MKPPASRTNVPVSSILVPIAVMSRLYEMQGSSASPNLLRKAGPWGRNHGSRAMLAPYCGGLRDTIWQGSLMLIAGSLASVRRLIWQKRPDILALALIVSWEYIMHHKI